MLDDEVYDSFGHRVGQIADGLNMTWSPDDRHICERRADQDTTFPSSWSLWLAAVDGGSRRIGPADGDVIAACDTQSGVAVLLSQQTGDEEVVDLRTSKVLADRPFYGATAVSPDGHYTAVETAQGDVITDTITGKVLATSPIRPRLFSGDDSRVLGDGSSGTAFGYSVYDWKAKQLVWTYPDSSIGYSSELSQPGAGGIALTLRRDVPPPATNSPFDLWLVPVGTAVLAGRDIQHWVI